MPVVLSVKVTTLTVGIYYFAPLDSTVMDTTNNTTVNSQGVRTRRKKKRKKKSITKVYIIHSLTVYSFIICCYTKDSTAKLMEELSTRGDKDEVERLLKEEVRLSVSEDTISCGHSGSKS